MKSILKKFSRKLDRVIAGYSNYRDKNKGGTAIIRPYAEKHRGFFAF